MHDLPLIPTLTGGLAAALVLGYVTHRLGLSPIVGYLLAGLAVGPYTPGFVADHGMAEQLAEIGVILLMFGVGLHFHLNELLAVRRVAIPGAIGQIVVATALGALVAVYLGPAAEGWTWTAGLVFGLAISVASTVVLVRVLADNRDLHTPTGHVAVGWLVVEDLFTVVVLVLLPALFPLPPGAAAHGHDGKPTSSAVIVEGTETAIAPLVSPYHSPSPAEAGSPSGSAPAGGSAAVALLTAAVKIGVLVALVFVVGGRTVPWLLNHVAETRSRELFTLTVLVTALGIAAASAQFFGVSMALGAFLAGMIVGRSEFSLRAASEALPMRDAFAVLFFVSVGMLFSPAHLLAAPGFVAATLAVVLVGKPLAAAAIVLVLGHPPRTALAVAVALAQIGEFSFMLAVLGNKLHILPPQATQTLVAAAIVSITLNPLLYRLVGPAEAWAAKRPRLWAWLNARVRKQLPAADSGDHEKSDSARSADPQRRAVIVGFGPVGRTAARLLRDNGIEPTIVELNIETVRRLLAAGEPAVYGDAGRRDTLEEAGAARAGSLILTASGLHDSEEIVRLARELNPKIRVLARSEYVREMPALRKAGAQTVFSGEGEVALALTVAILRGLGATPDQIDRERERVHAELSSEAAPPDLPPEEAAGPAPEAVVFEPAATESEPAPGGESSLPKGEVPTAAKAVDHAAAKPADEVPPTQPEIPPS